MTSEQAFGLEADRDDRWVHRLGAISAVALAIGYILTIPLYASVGAPPSGGEAWLEYAVGKSTAWWAILDLQVLTDFLFIPVAFSLYLALKEVNKNAMRLGIAFVGLFVVLDLAVTWSNYAALITLADSYAATTVDAERAAYVAAASHASAVLKSTLEGVYSIVTLAVGILIIGLVMLRSVFNRTTAYLGVATGVLGIASVVGAVFLSALSLLVIIASVLTTIWLLLVGYRLYRLSQP